MRNSRSMLPPGGTEMTTRMVRAACDHADWSVTVTRLSKATAATASGSNFRMGISLNDVLACRGHHDLDHLGRRLQPRLDAGARRTRAPHHPGVPDLVELVDGAHVLQPDHRLHKLRFIGAALLEQAVDLGQDFLGLLGYALARGGVG